MKRFSLMVRRWRTIVYHNAWQITALTFFLIAAFFQLPCFSATIQLTWDPNSDASYYIVYWGGASGEYTSNSQPIYSPSTTYTLTLDDGSTYYFSIRAFDDCGNSSGYSEAIAYTTGPDLSSPPTNLPPVADAGIDQSVGKGQSVTLTGAQSSDPDDGIATYQWVQISGTSVTLTNSGTVRPSFIAPDTGTSSATLAFRLTVTDYGGLSDADDCNVQIQFINEQPSANAGPDQSVGEGQSVTLNGNQSSDPDDGIASYQWSQISGTTVSITNPTSVSSSFTAPEISAAGETLAFRLTVTDKGGLTAYDDCLVMVSNINKTPIANAGTDLSVDEGLIVTLDGSRSSDPDDGIASYQWAQTSGPSVTLSSPGTAKTSFTAPDIGTSGAILGFRLTVTDLGGLSATDDCIVTVQFVNEPPYADAGPDQTVDEGQTVTLNAGNSKDPDDGIASYVWFQTLGPTVTLSSNTAVQPTFTTPEASTEGLTLTFQLVVEDNQGVMSADTCDILVKDSAIVEYPDAPVSPQNATVTLAEFPTIEVLGTDFQHKYWLKIGWAEYTAMNGEARVATGDIDGDGQHEIIIGLGQVADNPGIPGGFFQVLDHDFSHMAWGYVNWPEYNAVNGETWPACGDLDGDGDDEVIIGLGPGGDGSVEVFDYDQGGLYHLEWIKGAWPEYNSASGEIRPACGDIDQDGLDEIIAGLGPVNGITDMPGGYFEIIDSTFAHITWGTVSWPDYNAMNGETRPALGDVSGSGKDAIFIGLGEGGSGRTQMFNYVSNALTHNTWIQVDWPEYNDLSGETRPALADIDQDGKDEILTGLGGIKKSRTIPDGMFQANDDSFSLLTWGQVSWADYNLKNGETTLSYGIVQGTPSVFVSLGSRQEKTTGTSKPPPGKNK